MKKSGAEGLRLREVEGYYIHYDRGYIMTCGRSRVIHYDRWVIIAGGRSRGISAAVTVATATAAATTTTIIIIIIIIITTIILLLLIIIIGRSIASYKQLLNNLRQLLWAVTFIPMPMPKRVCRTCS